MKKLFLVPLMALMTCVSVYAEEVSTLESLQSALAAGGEITLTADIDADLTQLTVEKGVTIKGGGHCIKGINTYVFIVTTSEPVVMENLVIYAAKTSKAGRGIRLGNDGAAADNAKLALSNVTINATYRAMDVWFSDGVTLNINDCVFQNVQGQVVDAKGNPTAAKYDIELTSNNASDTRGLNFGQLTHSRITITNTTMQGFFYVLNNVTGSNGDMTDTKLAATNCTFKGRAALNVWGFGAEYEFTDCTIVGINNYGGGQEGFACFVLNSANTCHDNTLIINGGTVVSAVFDAVGGSNPNASQYMVDDRATDNTIVINNSSYTCTKELGDDKGGIIASTSPTSDITINGGTYDCPNIVGGTSSDVEGNTGSITITGGEFNVSTVSPDMNDGDVYSTVEIQGGTFQITSTNPETGAEVVVDIADLVDPNNAENTLLGNTSETIKNQDGTVSVVPQGTGVATEKVDPAIKTNLVWGTDVTMTAQNVVVQPTQTLTLNSGTANAYRLDMGQNATVIVKSGSTLTIGEGGVALNNNGANDPKIIVEQGATLVLNGLMYGSVPENLLVKASPASYGQLLVNPNVQAHGDNHPNGTFEFVTRSFYQDDAHYQFERFGIPTYTTVESVECNVPGLYTGIYVYENEDWQYLGYLVGGTPFANTSRLNTPFATCNLIAYNYSNLPTEAIYSFKGGLTGNSNASLNCNLDWNPFANSYTADVDAALFLSGLGSDANVTKAIYIAVPQGQGQYRWDGYDPELVAEYLADNGKKLVVRPMQAFILRNKHMAEVKTINYQNAVWNPGTSAGAPARVSSVSDNTARVRIMIDNGQGLSDYLNLTESATYASKVDKYMNDDVNIYAHDADDLLSILSAEDIQDTYVGFSTVQGGNFTISFPKATGRAFTLVDLETGAEVDAEQGNTYSFSAAPNTNADYRFKLVECKKVMTGAEDIRAEKVAKGIYTIMGQYLGEMNIWSSLPAGVYVMDGEKRVK